MECYLRKRNEKRQREEFGGILALQTKYEHRRDRKEWRKKEKGERKTKKEINDRVL